jgi:hypothetical protein
MRGAADTAHATGGVYASAAAGAGLAWRTGALMALFSAVRAPDGGAYEWAFALTLFLARPMAHEPAQRLTGAVLGPLLQRSPGAAASVRDGLARCSSLLGSMLAPHAASWADCTVVWPALTALGELVEGAGRWLGGPLQLLLAGGGGLQLRQWLQGTMEQVQLIQVRTGAAALCV